MQIEVKARWQLGSLEAPLAVLGSGGGVQDLLKRSLSPAVPLAGNLVVSPLPSIAALESCRRDLPSPEKETGAAGGHLHPVPHRALQTGPSRVPQRPSVCAPGGRPVGPRAAALAKLRVLKGAGTGRLFGDLSSGTAKPRARSRRAGGVGREGVGEGDWRGRFGWPERAPGEGIPETRKCGGIPVKPSSPATSGMNTVCL